MKPTSKLLISDLAFVAAVIGASAAAGFGWGVGYAEKQAAVQLRALEADLSAARTAQAELRAARAAADDDCNDRVRHLIATCIEGGRHP